MSETQITSLTRVLMAVAARVVSVPARENLLRSAGIDVLHVSSAGLQLDAGPVLFARKLVSILVEMSSPVEVADPKPVVILVRYLLYNQQSYGLRPREVAALNEMLESPAPQSANALSAYSNFPPGTAPAAQVYLEHLITTNESVNFRGIRSDESPFSIPLEDVFVPVKATEVQRYTEQLDSELEVEGGEGSLGSRSADKRVAQVLAPSLNIFGERRKLVVLGGPGTGKTALSAYLALTYAREILFGGYLEERLHLREILLPILIPLREFARYMRNAIKGFDGVLTSRVLPAFCDELFKGRSDSELPTGFFARVMEQGNALLLLDGLDEVADLGERSLVSDVIAEVVKDYSSNRFVVSSRTAAYKGAARLTDDFFVTTLQPLDEPAIEAFARKWLQVVDTQRMATQKDDRAEHGNTQIEAHIQDFLFELKSNRYLWELAATPLLLTIIATLYSRKGTIPHYRADLYEQCTEVLLGYWDYGKSGPAAKDLAQYAGPAVRMAPDEKRDLLQPVALWFHENHRKTADEGELQTVIAEQFQSKGHRRPTATRYSKSFLRIIQVRSGVMHEQEQGSYSFSHTSFQEYLAARNVCSRSDFLTYLLERASEDWWREVELFAAGHLAKMNWNKAAALVMGLANKPSTPTDISMSLLAATALLNIGAERADSITWDNITSHVLRLMSDPSIILRRRVDAGKIVGDLGDPRDLGQMAVVPAGEFLMGSSDEEIEAAIQTTSEVFSGNDELIEIFSQLFLSERPKHRLSLDEYQIGLYPVTNSQYEAFLRDTGHPVPQLKEKLWAAPYNWERGTFPPGRANHPVTLTRWEDADRYCDWLSSKTGKNIHLPSEAQWEKAARGVNGSIFPWGNVFVKELCNTYEGGLGETISVGLLAEGVSKFGVYDTIGNIWEWTRDEYLPYPGNEYPNENYGKGIRVAKGASYFSYRNYARCAGRYPFNPSIDRRGVSPLGFRIVEELT